MRVPSGPDLNIAAVIDAQAARMAVRSSWPVGVIGPRAFGELSYLTETMDRRARRYLASTPGCGRLARVDVITMPRSASIPCAGGCGRLCWKSWSCRPPGEQMCRSCQMAETVAKRAVPDAQCAFCSNPFRSVRRSDGTRTECCGRSCAGKLFALRHGKSLGRQSARRKRDLAEKCERRRAVMVLGDVDMAYVAYLKAGALHCPLCSIEMVDEPFLPESKELDHVIPLLAGGTHTKDNVRIICRYCNLRRPKDGSDELRHAT
jgi:5-methylcytosine-specific restriction endonuclease McrA